MTLTEFADLIEGKVWQKAGKNRIYFRTDRTANAYIDYGFDSDLDKSELMEDAKLCVYSNCESQSRQWNINRAKQIKHELMLRISEVNGLEVCDRWEDVL